MQSAERPALRLRLQWFQSLLSWHEYDRKPPYNCANQPSLSSKAIRGVDSLPELECIRIGLQNVRTAVGLVADGVHKG
jgi:hypothetical protein